MYYITLRVSADPWALEGPFGLAKRPQTMKFSKIIIMHETLRRPNLLHMDFLDHPAATTTCTDPISCTTNSAIQNEHSNLEKTKKNRPKLTYSFLGSRPAINPAEYYSSCACIVLLSEASSSSHVLFSTSCVSTDPWAQKRRFGLV